MRRWLLALLPALLLLLGAPPAAHAAPADAPQAQTFGIQPATATDPDARGTFGYSATPGALVKDHVAVWNYSDQPLTLRLYPADAFNTDSGGYDVLPEGKPSTQAGSWIRTAVNSLDLPARSRQIVPFTLAVPANAAPGDHAAGIVVALRQQSKDANGNNVTVDQRVGARVNLRVSGDLRAELTVQDARAVYHPSLNPLGSGSTTVTYTVRNTGNVRLGGKQAVRVTNAFGTTATGTAPADLQELLPGSSVTYRVHVSGAFPTLWGTAGITVDPLAVAGDRDPALHSTVRKQRYATVPWVLLTILLLLAALGLAVLNIRRRNRRLAALRPPAAAPIAVTAALAALLTLGQLGTADRAAAEPVPAGTLAFDYPTGHDDDAIDLLTDGQCPHPGTDYLALKLTGPGFPAEGAPLIGTTSTGAYRAAANGGFVIPLSNTLRVVANRAGVTQLNGDYTVTATCRGKVNPASLRDFTGTLTFTGPTTWKAGAVAPEGVIHAAAADPATAPANAPTAAPATDPGSSLAPWLATAGGLLLLGLAAVPQLRKRRAAATAKSGGEPSELVATVRDSEPVAFIDEPGALGGEATDAPSGPSPKPAPTAAGADGGGPEAATAEPDGEPSELVATVRDGESVAFIDEPGALGGEATDAPSGPSPKPAPTAAGAVAGAGAE